MVEPVTTGAVIGGIKLVASIASLLSSSADPSQTAIFETFRSVQVAHERLKTIEEGLIEIHRQNSALPDYLQQALMQQTAREASVKLETMIVDMTGIYGAYLGNLDQTSKMTPSAASDLYEEDLRDRRVDNARTIVEAMINSPLALDRALEALSFEIYAMRRLGYQPAAIRNYSQSRLNVIEEVINGPLTEVLTKARLDYETALTALPATMLMADPLTSTVAVIPSGSFHDNRIGQVRLLCVEFERVKLHDTAGIEALELAETGPRMTIVWPDKPEESVEACGVPIVVKSSTAGGERLVRFSATEGYERNCSEASTFVRSAHQFRRDCNKYVKAREKSFFDSARTAYGSVESSLAVQAIAAERYAYLLHYREGVVGAISAFSAQLDRLAAMSTDQQMDEAFAEEIGDIEEIRIEFPADRVAALDRAEQHELSLRLRNQMIEASLAADRKVQASMARLEGAISKRATDDALRIANALKQITLAIEVFDAIDKLTAEEKGKLTTAPIASRGAAPVATPAYTSEGVAAGAGGIPDAGTSPEPALALQIGGDNYSQAKNLLDRLKVMGVPSAAPGNAMVEQEALAMDLTGLLASWGPTEADKVYESYLENKAKSSGDVVDMILDPSHAVKVILTEALLPTVMSDQTVHSVRMRDQLRREAMPYLRAIRDWRAGRSP